MPGPPFSNGPRHASELIDCATGAPASRRGSDARVPGPTVLDQPPAAMVIEVIGHTVRLRNFMLV